MAQAIIQQQPVDGDFNDAVDAESDISGDDSRMAGTVNKILNRNGFGEGNDTNQWRRVFLFY